MYACTCIMYININVYIYIYIYIYTFTFMYIIHVHTYIYCTYTCTYIHIYIYIAGLHASRKCYKRFLALTISSCYGSIPLALRLTGRDGGLSTLCHSCGFACHQRALKKFPSLGYLRSEDGIV